MKTYREYINPKTGNIEKIESKKYIINLLYDNKNNLLKQITEFKKDNKKISFVHNNKKYRKYKLRKILNGI